MNRRALVWCLGSVAAGTIACAGFLLREDLAAQFHLWRLHRSPKDERIAFLSLIHGNKPGQPSAGVSSPVAGALLGDDDWEVRVHAIMALGKIGSAASDHVPLLSRYLIEFIRCEPPHEDNGHENPVRDAGYRIAVALKSIGRTSDLVRQVTKYIRAERDEVRERATWAIMMLGTQGPEMLPELLLALDDPSERVRHWAIMGSATCAGTPCQRSRA